MGAIASDGSDGLGGCVHFSDAIVGKVCNIEIAAWIHCNAHGPIQLRVGCRATVPSVAGAECVVACNGVNDAVRRYFAHYVVPGISNEQIARGIDSNAVVGRINAPTAEGQVRLGSRSTIAAVGG